MKFLRKRFNPSGPPSNSFVKIINISKNTTLAERAEIADTYWLRLKGLLGKRRLEPGAGLILKPCTSIHTLFMRFSIDVAFVDKQNRIVKAYHALHPWRSSGMFFSSLLCIELPSDILNTCHTKEGDYVQISPFSA